VMYSIEVVGVWWRWLGCLTEVSFMRLVDKNC
jgi:hypothetical protein